MKRIFFIILLAAEISVFGVVYAKNVTRDLSDNILRLHVVANSDSTEDQNIKFEIRDEIIKYISEKNFLTKEEITENTENIRAVTEKLLVEKGLEYSCRVLHDREEFPMKKYLNISLPEGRYECIKVILGEGKGKNWWCVAYPPLCFTEAVCGQLSSAGEERLQRDLKADSYKIIKGEGGEYKIKFLTVDIINKLFADK